ncbi:hypothetical protein GCM10009806_07240 [Microbacterium flavum]
MGRLSGWYPPTVNSIIGMPKALEASKTGASRMPWIQDAPRSVTKPPVRSVQTRPPIRSRASRTTTRRPAPASRRAAVSPAMPAPMTIVSMSVMGGVSFDG